VGCGSDALAVTIEKTYFMLMVADMKRAVNFYQDALGLSVEMQSRWWSELQSGGATIALHGGGGPMTQTGLGFHVDDLDAAVAAVEAHGGAVVGPAMDRPQEGIRLAEVRDTEGNGFSLAQTLARS
jgi:predicted enzyme related to lactoylglutathione lyase